MLAVKTDLAAADLPENLNRLRAQIERDVPWELISTRNRSLRGKPRALTLGNRMEKLERRFPKLRILDEMAGSTNASCGASSGRSAVENHFVEICLDSEGAVWIMLHSGSRNVGNTIGQRAMPQAREESGRNGSIAACRIATLRGLTRGTPEFEAVRGRARLGAGVRVAQPRSDAAPRAQGACKEPWGVDVGFVGESDQLSSQLRAYRGALRRAHLGDAQGCGERPHRANWASFRARWARRALSCAQGEASSYSSCSHGAGRRMSRTQAAKTFTRKDLALETAGVECRKDEGVIDEIPSAYKDIDDRDGGADRPRRCRCDPESRFFA